MKKLLLTLMLSSGSLFLVQPSWSWTTITEDNTNAFVVEKADGTDVFKIDTVTKNTTIGNAVIGDPNVRGQGVFLASAFKNGDNKLYLFASNDGRYFSILDASPFFTSPSTLLRDPSIMYWKGKYWIAFTSEVADGNKFRLASSSDLINWTDAGFVDCSAVAGAPNAGAVVIAPEWFNDGGTL